jgi:hypothetical protein
MPLNKEAGRNKQINKERVINKTSEHTNNEYKYEQSTKSLLLSEDARINGISIFTVQGYV